jgi:hypothetical protein
MFGIFGKIVIDNGSKYAHNQGRKTGSVDADKQKVE